MNKKENFIQALKFLGFSVSAGVIQVLCFTVLNEWIPAFSGDYGINYVIALFASIVWNFTFNRKYTFKSSNDIKKSMLLVLLFYVVFTPVSAVLGQHFKTNGINEYVILAMTMIANFVLEFLYTKYIVYKK